MQLDFDKDEEATLIVALCIAVSQYAHPEKPLALLERVNPKAAEKMREIIEARG